MRVSTGAWGYSSAHDPCALLFQSFAHTSLCDPLHTLPGGNYEIPCGQRESPRPWQCSSFPRGRLRSCTSLFSNHNGNLASPWAHLRSVIQNNCLLDADRAQTHALGVRRTDILTQSGRRACARRGIRTGTQCVQCAPHRLLCAPHPRPFPSPRAFHLVSGACPTNHKDSFRILQIKGSAVWGQCRGRVLGCLKKS